MRIIVCCGGFPSISETFVMAHILGLERRGHQVTVVAEELNPSLLSTLPDGIPSGGIVPLNPRGEHTLSSFGSKTRLLLKALPAIPTLLGGKLPVSPFLGAGLRWRGVLSLVAHQLAAGLPKMDLVHAHFGPTALWARAMAARLRVPMSVTFHGYDATRFPQRFGWEAYRPLLEGPATTLVAHSFFIADRIQRGLGLEALAVPLGVDTRLFAPRNGARPLQETRKGPRLAFVGNLIRQKGIRVAIETLALLRRGQGADRLPATLDVVGRGPEGAPAEKLSEVLGVRESLGLHGPLPPEKVAEVLSASDFLLVPSSRDLSGAVEGFGLVSLEAQSCGTLVVGTDVGGLPEAVSPPVGGRCVPQQSPAAMAEAIRELWSAPDLEDLRVAARERILKMHTMDAYLRGYERVYEDMVDRQRTGITRLDSRQDSWRALVWKDGRDWSPLERAALGSLVAYMGERDVVAIERQGHGDSALSSKAARSWTVASSGAAAHRIASSGKPFEILLDLEGVSPENLLQEALSFRASLEQGGTAILAVRLRDSDVSFFCDRLEGVFRQVLALDALFRPGPRSGEEARVDEALNGLENAGTSLRYVVCRT